MKLGIKVSLRRDSRADIEVTHPQMAEVWYDASHTDDYMALLVYMKQKQIEVGLHYWGALTDGTWTNIAYPDQTVIDASMDLMKKTIDEAARHMCVYVNIHTNPRTHVQVDLAAQKIISTSAPQDEQICADTFLQNVLLLHEYATNRGVLLTVETVPARDRFEWNKPATGGNFLNLYQLPVTTYIELSRRGLWIANDFCHTATNTTSTDPKRIWEFLYKTTKTLRPQTRLIHLGYLVPPYNGTDNHDTLDNPIFETDRAIPNNKQIIELLQLFHYRDDVWILVEPKEDHVKNYFLARGILEKAGVLTR